MDRLPESPEARLQKVKRYSELQLEAERLRLIIQEWKDHLSDLDRCLSESTDWANRTPLIEQILHRTQDEEARQVLADFARVLHERRQLEKTLHAMGMAGLIQPDALDAERKEKT